MTKLLHIIVLLLPAITHAQLQEEISFSFLFEGERVQLDKEYILNDADTIRFSKIRLYVSDFHFENNKVENNAERNGPWLLDAEKENTFKIDKPNEAATFSFCVGLDSLVNTSGALGGDLDPMNGMYWTWQSGYIHLKIEGSCSSLQTRNKAFSFHLGGYQHPHRAFEHRTFTVSSEGEVSLQFPLDSFLESMDLQETNSIMSPSITASELLSVFTSQILLAE
ncbi:MAG: hypothetical protein P8H59_08405 [Flavobacteriales bacterium]|nr:hypothetical protein [Flavobacteriales bacterium]